MDAIDWKYLIAMLNGTPTEVSHDLHVQIVLNHISRPKIVLNHISWTKMTIQWTGGDDLGVAFRYPENVQARKAV